MTGRILITGSDGLIGTALTEVLQAQRLSIRAFDLRRQQDVLDPAAVRAAVAGCCGIVHLAAVSRVIWGEQEPGLCQRTNVEGTRNVLLAAQAARQRPWVIFASSREVYGNAVSLPATEETPLLPCNVYGRSKVAAEELCLEARPANVRTAIVRLSNVYGSTRDHADRVVPCFARRAACGEPLRVEGPASTFDFTHVSDAARGLALVIEALAAGEARLPPIHFLTGQPTTLAELALLANRAGGGRSEIVEAKPRTFDVARFYGDPRRALELLGWRPTISVSVGLSRLLHEFVQQSGVDRSDLAASPRPMEARP